LLFSVTGARIISIQFYVNLFSNAFNILFLQGFFVAKIEPKSKDYGDKEN
jgi:hypothetical protein